MARSTSDEELQLKKRARRRLVGAVVLAAAVAVILPMVLDTEPKPVSQNVNIQIPSPDAPPAGKPVPPAVVEAPAPAGNAPSAPLKPDAALPALPGGPSTGEKAPAVPPVASVPPAAPAESRSSPEATKPAEKGAAKEAPKAAAKEASKPADALKATANGKFVVQLAALSDAAKAKHLQQQVAAAGVKAYTEVVKTSKGNVTRVRAGPYESREAAEKARGKLRSAGLDGKVVPR